MNSNKVEHLCRNITCFQTNFFPSPLGGLHEIQVPLYVHQLKSIIKFLLLKMQSNFLDWLLFIDALNIKTELTPINFIVRRWNITYTTVIQPHCHIYSFGKIHSSIQYRHH